MESAYICHNLRAQKKTFAVNSQNKRQAIGIQETFTLEYKFQNNICQQVINIFLAASTSVLNSCYDENVHAYATI